MPVIVVPETNWTYSGFIAPVESSLAPSSSSYPFYSYQDWTPKKAVDQSAGMLWSRMLKYYDTYPFEKQVVNVRRSEALARNTLGWGSKNIAIEGGLNDLGCRRVVCIADYYCMTLRFVASIINRHIKWFGFYWIIILYNRVALHYNRIALKSSHRCSTTPDNT